MIRKFGLLLAGLMLTISVFAQSTWEADPYHSKLTFSTTHLGIADIAGLFESFEAKIVTDKDDFSDAVFELTVDISSINTAVKMRDDHLRSEDFFHVEEYPTMTYKSTKIRKAGKDKYKLTGELTFHGVKIGRASCRERREQAEGGVAGTRKEI